MRFAVTTVALVLWACAPIGTGAGARSTVATPTEMRVEVERSERLGRAIFDKDVAAARATDALFRTGVRPGDASVGGWVTVPYGSGWVVTFGAESGTEFVAVREVRFPEGIGGHYEIASPGPPAPLVGETAAMFRARRTALAALPYACKPRYNTVVLPGAMIDRPGWLVYLLAATTVPGEIVVGGHYRVHVTADGNGIIELDQLSQSCLSVHMSVPPGADPTAVFVTNLVTAWPLETHVFLSLLHDRAIVVGAADRVWEVDRGMIRALE